MSSSKKYFSRTVSLAAVTSVSIASLMRTAGYGFEMDSDNNITTTPSLDSFIGAQCFIVPQADTIWVGDNQYVSSNNVVGPPRLYQGVPAASGESYNVVQAQRGIVDVNQVWLYSDSSQTVSIVFVAA